MSQAPVDAERSARSFDTRHADAASAARQILTINARFPFSMGGGFQSLFFLSLRKIGRSQALAKIISHASRRARFADTLHSLFKPGVWTGKIFASCRRNQTRGLKTEGFLNRADERTELSSGCLRCWLSLFKSY
ncbi:hypothetical protein ACJMK2_004751 [Sinanodonta woodiana]|uniref:Uncharacterized protein n=1 Tax=Sinanodonta woodiana TaxID=1069815 RepID=A0ABD3VPK3_SINWO